MKPKLILTLIVLFWTGMGLQAQTLASPDRFFDKKQLMPIGAYYYPEQWPEADWEPNLKKMSELGFTFTHLAEFAWHELEPEEGKYDFAWLDKVVSLADKYHLKVIMCTPSPCPPTWMVRKYPETVVMNKFGQRMNQGTRRHGNSNSAVFNRAVEKIVTEMAKHYGNDPRILGWQLDNEPQIANREDYSPESQTAFRIWLKKKYNNNLAKLNHAWGTPFWSQVYNSFDEIDLPNPSAGGENHHHRSDFQLFNADVVAGYLKQQADILHKLVSPKQYVTTNYAYMKFLPETNPMLTKGALDFATYTMYPMNTWLEYGSGDLNYRLGSGMEMSYACEFAKSHSGSTAVMELQPGQINWGSYNAMPLPGAVRMWLYHNLGMGSKFVCTYRFRQPVFGGEMWHKGIMETDGQTVSPGGKEYVQVIEELKKLQAFAGPNATPPADWASRKTAFLWSHANLADWQNMPHNNNWNYWQPVYNYYSALKTLGAPVTFITEDQNFDPKEYPFLVVPAYAISSHKLIAKWEKYVQNGGNLIFGCRTAIKDSLAHLWKGLPSAPLSKLIGASIPFFDQLPPSKSGKVTAGSNTYTWNLNGEILIPETGTRVLATHVAMAQTSAGPDPYYAGKAAVVSRKLGKGTVTYIGVHSSDRKLEADILSQIYTESGAQVLKMPPYAFTEWRDGLWVTVNYTSEIVKAPVNPKSKILVGVPDVKPGEVCVWTNPN